MAADRLSFQGKHWSTDFPVVSFLWLRYIVVNLLAAFKISSTWPRLRLTAIRSTAIATLPQDSPERSTSMRRYYIARQANLLMETLGCCIGSHLAMLSERRRAYELN